MNWIKDNNGNQCSVEYWGTKEAAQEALDSLKNCSDCSDCSLCSSCSSCSDCFRCSFCSSCSGCSLCSSCSRCYRCSDCSLCSSCSSCSDCSRCSHCPFCSGCYDCSLCYLCSGCSDCFRCSFCSFCSSCYYLEGEKKLVKEQIVVPIILNIHQRVYEAASQPNAFSMKDWHTCEKKNCRAGWVVALAGEGGKKLEEFFDTPLAAMKIYDASSTLPKVSPVRFFETDDLALADMKRMAELEKANE